MHGALAGSPSPARAGPVPPRWAGAAPEGPTRVGLWGLLPAPGQRRTVASGPKKSQGRAGDPAKPKEGPANCRRDGRDAADTILWCRQQRSQTHGSAAGALGLFPPKIATVNRDTTLQRHELLQISIKN